MKEKDVERDGEEKRERERESIWDCVQKNDTREYKEKKMKGKENEREREREREREKRDEPTY